MYPFPLVPDNISPSATKEKQARRHRRHQHSHGRVKGRRHRRRHLSHDGQQRSETDTRVDNINDDNCSLVAQTDLIASNEAPSSGGGGRVANARAPKAARDAQELNLTGAVTRVGLSSVIMTGTPRLK